MALPIIHGEFTVVTEPELRFNDNGKAWLKIRGVAKDRVRDNNGGWTDGDPLFIDILLNMGAEHMCESIAKGDSIIVSGKLRLREYQKDDEKRVAYQIHAESAGVSTRWGPARTAKALEGSNSAVNTVKNVLGGTQLDEAPF